MDSIDPEDPRFWDDILDVFRGRAEQMLSLENRPTTVGGGPSSVEEDVFMVAGMRAVVLAIERRDWDQLITLLHPYLHWTCADGENIRGRKNVLMRLAQSPPSGRPFDYELRDGQIYRWVEPLPL